jgi:hypothetical protein
LFLLLMLHLVPCILAPIPSPACHTGRLPSALWSRRRYAQHGRLAPALNSTLCAAAVCTDPTSLNRLAGLYVSHCAVWETVPRRANPRVVVGGHGMRWQARRRRRRRGDEDMSACLSCVALSAGQRCMCFRWEATPTGKLMLGALSRMQRRMDSAAPAAAPKMPIVIARGHLYATHSHVVPRPETSPQGLPFVATPPAPTQLHTLAHLCAGNSFSTEIGMDCRSQ